MLPQSPPSLLLLHATGALSNSTPAISEYPYFHDANEINRVNHALPIRFNGLTIGTNELDSEGANGTIHALAEGHHFGQRKWYLSGADGGSWEYLPALGSSSLSSLKERDGGGGGDGEQEWCAVGDFA